MFQGDLEFAFGVPWAGIVDVLATNFAKQSIQEPKVVTLDRNLAHVSALWVLFV